jgi:hypothetical protein
MGTDLIKYIVRKRQVHGLRNLYTDRTESICSQVPCSGEPKVENNPNVLDQMQMLIIGLTIDAVQDQVLEPAMPLMALVDRLLGPVDERLISKLITHGREKVWLHATRLLDTDNPDSQKKLIQQIEEEAIETGKFILL